MPRPNTALPPPKGPRRPAARPRGRGVGAALVVLVAIAFTARVVARNEEYSSGLTMARTVLERWPTPAADHMVGTELNRLGQYEEAVPHLRRAVPGYPPARFHLGMALFNVGKLDDAIVELQTAIRDEPGLVNVRDARLHIGRAFETKGQWPQAVDEYRRVLAASPADAYVHGLLAGALAGMQAFSEAIAHYRVFLAAHPQDADAWTGLAIALVSSGNTGEAVGAFRRAVEAAPRNGYFRLNLARALVDRGEPADLKEAIQQARQAVDLLPNDPAARELLAHLQRVLRDR